MSKHIHPRPIGISRTGKRKDPANWTPGEHGMAAAQTRRLTAEVERLKAEKKDLADALEMALIVIEGRQEAADHSRAGDLWYLRASEVCEMGKSALKRAGR